MWTCKMPPPVKLSTHRGIVNFVLSRQREGVHDDKKESVS